MSSTPPKLSILTRNRALLTTNGADLDSATWDWLNSTPWIEALADPGYSHHQSFFQELIYRLNEVFLPERSPEKDIFSHLLHLHWTVRESREVIHQKLTANIVRAIESNALPSETRDRLRAGVVRSYEMISGHFLSAAMILGDKAGEKVRTGNPGQSAQVDWDAIESALERTLERLRETGIYLDQVFLVEIQRRRLRRMRLLHALLSDRISVTDRARVLSTLILDLMDQARDRRQIFKFLKRNLRLTTLRIVEANSLHGEHYLIRNWAEYKMIFFGAAGGGICTAFTVLIKQFLGYLPLTDFSKGLSESINYSLSFLAIAYFGFFLATKQPSSTAPYLASAIKKNSREWHHALFSLIRAQTVSVMGNVLLVIPVCLVFAQIAILCRFPLMTPQYAAKTLQMANPIGFVPLYAAFTGVLLFFSSLLGGWFDNWTQIHSLPERIRDNPKLRRRLGSRLTTWLSLVFAKNASIMGSSVALGFLLGMSPQVLQFFNFPIETRHVTLTSGMLALALPHLQDGVFQWQTLFTLLSGVCLIAALNLSVSFALALSLASLSVDLPPFQTLKRVGKGVLGILSRPWNIFFPRPDSEQKP